MNETMSGTKRASIYPVISEENTPQTWCIGIRDIYEDSYYGRLMVDGKRYYTTNKQEGIKHVKRFNKLCRGGGYESEYTVEHGNLRLDIETHHPINRI